MAEDGVVIASAVIVPESPTLSSKRRQPSVSESDSKRPRLVASEPDGQDAASPTASPTTARLDRRASGQIDERKRGKRLFGALLGTLAQNSSSTAQKRRSDIERKQQEKLKAQAEDDDAKKQQKIDALMEVRRREQRKFEKQSMRIRHSNMLATAHFLQTRAEPKLFYRPWELLPHEGEHIDSQIKETEEVIDKEVAGSVADEEVEAEAADESTYNMHEDGGADVEMSTNAADGPLETVGDAANHREPPVVQEEPATDPKAESPGAQKEDARPEDYVRRDSIDEGADDVVDGEEDTVIY